MAGIYGRFDSKIRFEIESDGRFDSRFDSNVKKTIRRSQLSHCRRKHGHVSFIRTLHVKMDFYINNAVVERQNKTAVTTSNRSRFVPFAGHPSSPVYHPCVAGSYPLYRPYLTVADSSFSHATTQSTYIRPQVLPVGYTCIANHLMQGHLPVPR